MNSRERWRALFDRRKPDRIVTDYWTTVEFHRRIKTELNLGSDEALWSKLGIDRPINLRAPYVRDEDGQRGRVDPWGIRFASVDHGTGSYQEAVHHPLAHVQNVADVAGFTWPNPDDFDYGAVRKGVALFLADGGPDRPVSVGGYEPFLIYCNMRGMEQAYEDLLVNPEIADAIMGRIFDICYETNRRQFEAAGKGNVDLFYLAEDLGSQSGPLFSLEVYRKYFRPGQKRMADLARSCGAHIFYHTDGAARTFLPDLIHEVGIEILNPIQWRCAGMEREQLVKDFGGDVVFHGAVDNQHTLPFGTVDDVVAEVTENFRILGSSPRGWICAPCHNIQSLTPVANVVAMYETIHALG